LHIQNVLVAHSKCATSRTRTKCARNEFYPASTRPSSSRGVKRNFWLHIMYTCTEQYSAY